jgi:hypothetical protein
LTKTHRYIDKFWKQGGQTIQESDGTTSTVVYQKGDDEILLYWHLQKKVIFKDVIATRTVVVDDDYNNFGWKLKICLRK